VIWKNPLLNSDARLYVTLLMSVKAISRVTTLLRPLGRFLITTQPPSNSMEPYIPIAFIRPAFPRWTRPHAPLDGSMAAGRAPGGRPPKYFSSFGLWLPHQRVCGLTCDFSARCSALFAAAAQRLTPERRNNEHPRRGRKLTGI